MERFGKRRRWAASKTVNRHRYTGWKGWGVLETRPKVLFYKGNSKGMGWICRERPWGKYINDGKRVWPRMEAMLRKKKGQVKGDVPRRNPQPTGEGRAVQVGEEARLESSVGAMCGKSGGKRWKKQGSQRFLLGNSWRVHGTILGGPSSTECGISQPQAPYHGFRCHLCPEAFLLAP